jgi:hypothetical protein
MGGEDYEIDASEEAFPGIGVEGKCLATLGLAVAGELLCGLARDRQVGSLVGCCSVFPDAKIAVGAAVRGSASAILRCVAVC